MGGCRSDIAALGHHNEIAKKKLRRLRNFMLRNCNENTWDDKNKYFIHTKCIFSRMSDESACMVIINFIAIIILMVAVQFLAKYMHVDMHINKKYPKFYMKKV